MDYEKIRKVFDFNDNWRFSRLLESQESIMPTVEHEYFDDSHWEAIRLPHTWNAVDGADGPAGRYENGDDYYCGWGGYRKRFTLPDECKDKRIYIEFAGANTVAQVYVNGNFVGEHEGGYSMFRFDITESVKWDEENTLAVKVNNAPTDHIAPIADQGDFTKMGGIYRTVYLIAVCPIHISLSDYGSSGIYITPKNITEHSADIHVLVRLANEGSEVKAGTLSVAFRDMADNVVASAVCDVFMEMKSETRAEVLLTMPEPILWNGRENPYLYQAEICLLYDNVVQDQCVEQFGIRTCHIDFEKGFFLNGNYLDLHGANYHQDSYETGWAMTDEQRERDYQIMYDMGCNTVRMAHYQHDRYEYELCDRLGFTIWTEIGIINQMSVNQTDDLEIAEGFVENAKQQLTELIRQNYNHPSVIVWGISNELNQMSDEIFSIYEELTAHARKEDSTRLIAFADNQFSGRFMELPVDVAGYNRYFGWYKEAGPVDKLGDWLDSYHIFKEKRPLCLSEYGGGGAITQHKDNIDWENEIDPWGERHYENYQSLLHEKTWAQLCKRQYMWGKYVWCMFDFASDGREEGDTKGQNDKGLVTRERIPKDSYYFYQSVWSEKPMVHITEKRFSERPYNIPRIKVYSNGEKAELFINGISQGEIYASDLDACYPTIFAWENVQIDTGFENTIHVKATFADGVVLEDNARWKGKV